MMCLSVTMVVLAVFDCCGQILMIIIMMTKIRMMKIMCLSVSVVGG